MLVTTHILSNLGVTECITIKVWYFLTSNLPEDQTSYMKDPYEMIVKGGF